MSEQQPLLHSNSDSDDVEANQRSQGRSRTWLARKLETQTFHWVVIGLIALDSAIVLADLSYTFLSDSCIPDASPPPWLQALSEVSLGITVIFLVELVLCAWAFGPGYYSPTRSVLHFCDGTIIVVTFVVEVALRGRERELASLLILFRLLRFAAEAAVGVGEMNEGTSKELEEVKEALEEKTRALEDAQREVETLRSRLSASNNE